MSEIANFGTIVLLVSAGFGLALLSSKLTERLPIPPPAVFLIAAAAVSDIWPSLYRHTPIHTVERVAVVALIVILFNGGLDIGWPSFRESAFPMVALGVFGTFITAGVVMLFAHFALGFGWTLAGLAGAALAPTDPAVMFSVLGNHEIGGRSGTTLEGEAGLNDPAGIALMIGMIELATHANASAAVVVREFAVEMSVGLAFGLVGGWLLATVLRRIRLPSASLHPLLALALAAVLYGVTSRLHGSGFLAVFLAGLDRRWWHAATRNRDHEFHRPSCQPRGDRCLRCPRPDRIPRLPSVGGRGSRVSCSPSCSPLSLAPSPSSSPSREPASPGLNGRSWPGVGSREPYRFSLPRSPS